MDGAQAAGPQGMAMLQAAGAFGGYPEMALHLLAQQQAGAAHMVSHAHHVHPSMQHQQQDDDGGSRGGRTRSGDSRSSSAYASRHQQAEARRRTRINERLESLRRLVPHAERANTATFLEEVIKYVQVLQSRNTNLERMIRDLQQAPLPLSGAAGGPDAETIAAAARASQLIAQQQQQQQQGPGAMAGLGMPAGMEHMMQQLPQGMQQQAHLLRTGTSGIGSMGAMPGLQDASAQQGFGAAGASPALASNSPAAMLMQQQMQQQHQDSAAQSGAAALLAAAGATAAMAAGAGTGAPAAAKPASTSAVTTTSGGAAGPSGAGSARGSGAAAAAAAAPPAAAAAAAQKPGAVVQVPDMLQSLLPQGLDLQQMLQQALLSTQAQLLAQLQHHNKQTSSGTGGAAAGADAGAGAAATSSGGTSGQPATSTAPLSALQQALSAQQAAPTSHNSQGQPQQLPLSAAQQQQQQQLLQATAGLLAAAPGLVMPIGSEAEPKQPQLLQPAPALNINLQQQAPQPSSAGPTAPPVTAGLQDAANLLAINQIMAQLRANPTAGQLPIATMGLIGPSASVGGGKSAGCGSAGRPLSPSAAAGLPGASPRRAAAAAVTAGAAFSGGDGAALGGAMPSLPNLLAMAPPAGALEQRSSSMSGDREDEGSVQAAKKRKMLVL